MTVMTVPESLAEIRDEEAGASFPRDLLNRCSTALVLFSAAFYGKQDAFWVAAAGLRATCVDVDEERLGEMVLLYPASWTFRIGDAYEFARKTISRWDVVTVDCPSGQFERAAANAGGWCACARRAVVLGTGVGTRVVAPGGWSVTERRRRSNYDGGVFWTVLERSEDE